MFKNVSKGYKIFIISVSCVLLALAIVLITLFYTTQNNIKKYLSLDVLHLPQENKIDLDLSFTKKLNKVVYSTDMCLKDRLETIKKQDPEKYSLVVANIQYAKKFLKENGVYKSKNAREAQGGLGGVGVENWILQNGGSFREATETFLEAAEGRTFEQFKKEYEVWDFGQNIKSANENRYLYDNFVSNNMDESGYKKMVQALKEYQNTHTMQQQETYSQHN